jgi:hypothetical protein
MDETDLFPRGFNGVHAFRCALMTRGSICDCEPDVPAWVLAAAEPTEIGPVIARTFPPGDVRRRTA